MRILTKMIVFDKTKVTGLVKKEHESFPAAELRDYYKLFFQSLYGPGHFITNREEAENWLRLELSDYQPLSRYESFSLIGYNNDFCRVYLDVIKEEIISFDDYLNAFIKSAQDQPAFHYNEWVSFWSKVASAIKSLNIINSKDFSAQLEVLKAILDQNNYVLSHSKTYRSLYRPHYRVIKMSFLPIQKGTC